MLRPDLLKATFTISSEAKLFIETLRVDSIAQGFEETDVLSIAWGTLRLNNGGENELVVASFYDKSQYDAIKDGIQIVSGVPLVYFVTEKNHGKFDGKELHYEVGKGLHMRAIV